MNVERVTVYTDGSCRYREPQKGYGPGGWAWVAETGERASGFHPQTTSVAMELRAALSAMRAFKDVAPITIVTDHLTTVECFEKGYWRKWRSNGWQNWKREPLGNRDLWQRVINEALAGGTAFRHVRSHSNNELNSTADRLAHNAIDVGMIRMASTVPLADTVDF